MPPLRFTDLPLDMQAAVFDRMTARTSVRAQAASSVFAQRGPPRVRQANKPTPLANAIHQLRVATNQRLVQETSNRIRRLLNSGSKASRADINAYAQAAFTKLDRATFTDTFGRLKGAARASPTSAATIPHALDAVLGGNHKNTMPLNNLKNMHAMGVPVGGRALTHEMQAFVRTQGRKSGTNRLAFRMTHGAINTQNALQHADPWMLASHPDVMRPILRQASIPHLGTFLMRAVEAMGGMHATRDLVTPVVEALEARRRASPSTRHAVELALSRGMAEALQFLEVDDDEEDEEFAELGPNMIRRLMAAGADPFLKVVKGKSCLELLTQVNERDFTEKSEEAGAIFLEHNSLRKRVAVTRALARHMSCHSLRKDTALSFAEDLLEHNPHMPTVYKALLATRTLSPAQKKKNLRYLVQETGPPAGELGRAVATFLKSG